MIACDGEAAVREAHEELDPKVRPFQMREGYDGICLRNLIVESTDNISLKVANQFKRLSEWDDLHELGEVAQGHLAAQVA